MHALVSVISFAVVGGLVLYGLSSALGQWSILLWVGLGVGVLMAIAQKINA